MKQMAAGKFKEYCLSIMDHVQATGEPSLSPSMVGLSPRSAACDPGK